MPVQIMGNGLLSFIRDCEFKHTDRTRMVRMAGYVHPQSGKTAYVDFYTALISAKDWENRDCVENHDSERELTDEQKDLWDHVANRLNLDDAELNDIWDELIDSGLDSIEAFDDSYFGSFDGYDPDVEFARQWADMSGEMDESNTFYSYINWDDFAYRLLSDDYFKVESQYSTHYFLNC